MVTLSVSMLRSDGSRATKNDGDVKVSFFFLPGSANDQRAQRGADLTCRTGSDALCSVSYMARNVGLDTICAYVGKPGHWQRACSEPPEARDLDNDADVVRRRVAHPVVTPLGPPPTPTAMPTPAVTPTPGTPISEELIAPAGPGGGGSTPPGQAPAIAPQPQPAEPGAQGEWAGTLSRVWSAVAEGVARAVRPEAAATVATTFGFPLALMLAVLIFLVVQGLIDRRDPKLRRAPRTVIETMQKFRTEDEL